MKRRMRFLMNVATGYCLLTLIGCASMKEAGRGIAGTSVKILEETRADAVKKEFVSDSQTVTLRVKESLKKTGCYVYRQEPDKGLIAVYLSETDTTPVGIFLKGIDSGATLVEISSPSTYAKEFLMEKISGDLKDLVKAEKKEQREDALQGKADEKK